MTIASEAAPGAALDLDTRPAAPLLVTRLAGSQADMGRQHGELLLAAGGWQGTIDYYPRMPEVLIGLRGGVPLPLLRPILELWKRRLDRARPPEYRARTRAFYQALGLHPNQSMNVFVMDLLQNVVGLAGRLGIGPSHRLAAACAIPACSSIAVWGAASKGGTMRHARNFDFPGNRLWERQPEVVFCRPDGEMRYGFVTTRGADVPAVTAWNEAGITVGPHTRFHKDVRFDAAGIVDLVHSIVAKAETLADAERLVRERPVASTWGLLVSSVRDRSAVVLETTGKGVGVVSPRPGEDFLPQTNRYLAAPLREREVAPSIGHIANSDGRYRSLRVRARQGAMDQHDLQDLLGSHAHDETGAERPAGGVLAQGISVQSVVVEPEARVTHVSVGPSPTGGGPWVDVPWDWDGPVGATEACTAAARPCGNPSRFTRDPHRPAHERFVDAVAMDAHGATEEQIGAAVEAACELDPDESIYRLVAAGWRLRAGDVEGALAHCERGLLSEKLPFDRGQLLLWAARAAAAAGKADRARALFAELEALQHPLLGDHHEAAKRERARPPSRRALRKTQINMVFPDLVLR